MFGLSGLSNEYALPATRGEFFKVKKYMWRRLSVSKNDKLYFSLFLNLITETVSGRTSQTFCCCNH